MRRIPRSLIALAALTVAALSMPWEPFQVRLHAAITVVQSCMTGGNDQTCTFGAGWTSGNTIFAVSALDSQVADQLDLTGITATESDFGQINVGATYRFYGKCFVVSGSDIGDTTAIATTVGGLNAYTAYIEVSGANGCTEDGTETGNADNATPYNLTSTLTTTVDGSVILGVIKSTSASDYSAGTGMTAAVPSSGADVPGGDNTGTSLGGYRITTTAGAYDLVWNSAVNETSVMAAYALKAAVASSGCRNRISLLKVGGC